MLRSASWYLFLLVGMVIGLGAFGHGYSVYKVHEAIDPFPIEAGVHDTLYVVWYFVSGTMLTLGASIVWIAFRLRAGDASSLVVAILIGAFYFMFGVWAFIYRRGDPFWLLFVGLGALLVGSALVLRTGRPPVTEHRQRTN